VGGNGSAPAPACRCCAVVCESGDEKSRGGGGVRGTAEMGVRTLGSRLRHWLRASGTVIMVDACRWALLMPELKGMFSPGRI
jgi:hypothetical protein